MSVIDCKIKGLLSWTDIFDFYFELWYTESVWVSNRWYVYTSDLNITSFFLSGRNWIHIFILRLFLFFTWTTSVKVYHCLPSAMQPLRLLKQVQLHCIISLVMNVLNTNPENWRDVQFLLVLRTLFSFEPKCGEILGRSVNSLKGILQRWVHICDDLHFSCFKFLLILDHYFH